MSHFQGFLERAKSKSKVNKQTLDKLKSKKPSWLDEAFSFYHEQAFQKINCIDCANCCKTTSPIFYQKDIERLARGLRIKPSEFIEKYLRLDDDQDFVLQTAPCPFLGKDNYCGVYEDRPAACREYPHTNRKNIHQILELCFKNTMVCPAVLEIVENIQQDPRLRKMPG